MFQGDLSEGKSSVLMSVFSFLFSGWSGPEEGPASPPPYGPMLPSNYTEEAVSVSTKSFLCSRAGDKLVCTSPVRAECLVFGSERGVADIGRCLPLNTTVKVRDLLCAVSKTLKCD